MMPLFVSFSLCMCTQQLGCCVRPGVRCSWPSTSTGASVPVARDIISLTGRSTSTFEVKLAKGLPEGWSVLGPRCVGAAARMAGLSPLLCEAPISRRPVCLLQHKFPPIGSSELGGFSRVPADGSFLHFLNLRFRI